MTITARQALFAVHFHLLLIQSTAHGKAMILIATDNVLLGRSHWSPAIGVQAGTARMAANSTAVTSKKKQKELTAAGVIVEALATTMRTS